MHKRLQAVIAAMRKVPAAVLTYATWNPADKGANMTLSGGNLGATVVSPNTTVRSTIGKSSGKWYWEITVGGAATGEIGVATSSATLVNYLGADAHGTGWAGSNGETYQSATNIGTFATYSTGDVLGFALNKDATNQLTLYKNNILQGTVTIQAGTVFAAFGHNGVTNVMTANFGATPFVYSPPGGYNAGLYT